MKEKKEEQNPVGDLEFEINQLRELAEAQEMTPGVTYDWGTLFTIICCG